MWVWNTQTPLVLKRSSELGLYVKGKSYLLSVLHLFGTYNVIIMSKLCFIWCFIRRIKGEIFILSSVTDWWMMTHSCFTAAVLTWSLLFSICASWVAASVLLHIIPNQRKSHFFVATGGRMLRYQPVVPDLTWSLCSYTCTKPGSSVMEGPAMRTR